MQNNYDEGLINQYISQIEALAFKAQEGKDVEADIKAVLEKASTHFLIVKTSDSNANLARFKARLKLNAEIVHESQLKYKTALNLASKLIII
jgi:hypothetical protein